MSVNRYGIRSFLSENDKLLKYYGILRKYREWLSRNPSESHGFQVKALGLIKEDEGVPVPAKLRTICVKGELISCEGPIVSSDELDASIGSLESFFGQGCTRIIEHYNDVTHESLNEVGYVFVARHPQSRENLVILGVDARQIAENALRICFGDYVMVDEHGKPIYEYAEASYVERLPPKSHDPKNQGDDTLR